MAEILESAEFCFGNLESPISGDDSVMGKGLVFNTHTGDIAGLGRFGFKVVSLANNHALDQGVKGLRNTIAVLDRAGIAHPGAGADLAEAWRPALIESNGIRIAFIAASYSSVNDGGATRNDLVARIEDQARLESSIREARADADLVVVTMHAGIEYRRYPERGQIDFARRAIDLGADAVIGGHPHWIQTIERYRDKFIFYSLGNFIFDQRTIDTNEGLVIKVSVVKGAGTAIESIELIPVVSDKLASPRPATEVEARAILKKIGMTSMVLKP
jgi:poly-gamma-glutamate synthesis protein (capsule biosynthesis protein)